MLLLSNRVAVAAEPIRSGDGWATHAQAVPEDWKRLLSLFAPNANGQQTLNPYFYEYDSNGGLRVVTGRKSQSQSVASITETKVSTELRFLWFDIAEPVTPNEQGKVKRDFVFTIEAYPMPDSKVPSHVSSPWLVGTQPNWHSGYYRSLRLHVTQQPTKLCGSVHYGIFSAAIVAVV